MGISLSEINNATSIVKKHPNRLVNSYGHPGGLIDLSKDNKAAIIIGDLHGAVDNLRKIVNHEENLELLKQDKLRIILVGDGVHNDQTGQMKEMDSSIEVMEEVFHLINTYKEKILYLRGNHDTFDEYLAKSAIKQGLEFRLKVEETWGEEFVEAIEEFFEALPMFIIGQGYVITHAGPVRHGCSRQELIDIEDNPDYYRQLMWNRLHEFRGTPSLKEYDERDIKAMLEKLHLPTDTPFIVGHNPMWQTGNLTGIWRDIIGIKNHIIIYTNLQTKAPYLLIENGEITEKYALPKEAERFYV